MHTCHQVKLETCVWPRDTWPPPFVPGVLHCRSSLCWNLYTRDARTRFEQRRSTRGAAQSFDRWATILVSYSIYINSSTGTILVPTLRTYAICFFIVSSCFFHPIYLSVYIIPGMFSTAVLLQLPPFLNSDPGLHSRNPPLEILYCLVYSLYSI